VFLVLANAALQAVRPFLGDGARQLAPLSSVLAGPALSLEIGPDAVPGSEPPVLVGRIDGSSTGQPRSGPGELLGVGRRALGDPVPNPKLALRLFRSRSKP